MTEPSINEAACIEVEVVFAEPAAVWHKTLSLTPGTTASQAFRQSGFAQAYPGKVTEVSAMGIFGQSCREDHILEHGDRLELYRPLRFDPKESRRRRATHKKRVKNGRTSTV